MPSRASAAPAFLYVPGLGSEGSETELSDAESHYVSRVCRARLGDIVHATDGEGRFATLRLTAIERAVRATVDRVETVARLRHSWLLCGEPEGKIGRAHV